MKKRICLELLLSFLIFFLISPLQASVPDTAWTLTLPENEIVAWATFSNDDSLLIVSKEIITDDTNAIVKYFTIYNSYTGQLIRHLKERMNSRYYYKSLLKPGTDFLYLYFDEKYDSLYHKIPEQQFLIYNIRTGDIIDSLYFINSEPDLKIDTCNIWQMKFTPDGEHLFIRADVLKYYDYYHNPVWTQKLFVWSTNNWTLERKRAFGNRASFGFAPNNRYYYYGIINPNEYYLFDEISTDTTLLELQDNDSMKYEGIIFPKTDTNKFLLRYYDRKDARYKLQIRSQSNFSVIKTIDNDTICENPILFLRGFNYLLSKAGSSAQEIKGLRVIYDLINDKIVYVVPKFPSILGQYGPNILIASNNSELIFDGFSRTLRMYNAKYTTTSTKEPDKENPTFIYPNPAKDYIEISLSPLKRGDSGVCPVRIFDLLGIEMQSTPVSLADTPASGGHVRIDVSSLTPGVYFVRVGNEVRKFVKI